MNKPCCASCKYWVEKYWQCEHPQQFADMADEYDAVPEHICELFEERNGKQ